MSPPHWYLGYHFGGHLAARDSSAQCKYKMKVVGEMMNSMFIGSLNTTLLVVSVRVCSIFKTNEVDVI